MGGGAPGYRALEASESQEVAHCRNGEMVISAARVLCGLGESWRDFSRVCEPDLKSKWDLDIYRERRDGRVGRLTFMECSRAVSVKGLALGAGQNLGPSSDSAM